MFELFLEEYQKSIFKKARFRKNIPISEKVWMGITFVLLLLCCVLAFYRRTIAVYAAMLAAVISGGIFWRLCGQHRSRARDEEREGYLQRIAHPLEDLLQEEKYNLYSMRGIDWLIACCKEEINRKKNSSPGMGTSFFKYVFPFITLLFGKYLDRWDNLLTWDLLFLILFFLLAVWLVIEFYKSTLRQVPEDIAWIFGWRKAALPSLLSALEYVRVFAPESAAADTPRKRDERKCPPCCEECVVTAAR